eukprot:TRINITY_DN1165_c0_g3_i1.p1 TRINITY_DN1165_c0_g3~~TRINITY_DN1165_c0_g3_i1.p1  ORF type:complete len:488 (-),score=82.69 TRINITY_DN1165_c0_g3_i1:1188-2651(-)
MKKTPYLILLLALVFVMCKNSKDSVGDKLFELIAKGDIEQFKAEINASTDLNMTNSSGYSLLNYSIKEKESLIALFLIDSNADVNAMSTTKSSKSPLMYAVKYKQLDVLKLLIEKGADLKAKNSDGYDALDYANKYADKDVFAILADHIALYNDVDGPYILYSKDKVESASVTSEHELVREDVSNKKEFVVELPEPYKSFKVQLKGKNEIQKAIYPVVKNVFVVADIEGNISAFIDLLKSNKVIDADYKWIFGNGHLVLNGDFVDRGKYVTQVLWLIYKLESESEKAGGKVHFIIGNHEDMLLRANWKYTRQKYKTIAGSLGIDYKDLYGENTELGKWLRTKNLITKIGDCIYVHAGLSKELLDKKISIEEINSVAIPYVGADKKVRAGIELVDFLYGNMGIAWYRGLVVDSKKYMKITPNDLTALLQYYDAKRIIIGHNVVDEISFDFDGRVVRVDVDHHKKAQALLIENGESFYRVDDKGNKDRL